MAKYITIGSSEEKIPVNDIYAYIYESGEGKTVLRIKVDASVKTFDELNNLLNTGENKEIKAYELEESGDIGNSEPVYKLLSSYTNFYLDYKCDYASSKNEYSIEITKKSRIEIIADENQANTLDAYEAIVALYEM